MRDMVAVPFACNTRHIRINMKFILPMPYWMVLPMNGLQNFVGFLLTDALSIFRGRKEGTDELLT